MINLHGAEYNNAMPISTMAKLPIVVNLKVQLLHQSDSTQTKAIVSNKARILPLLLLKRHDCWTFATVLRLSPCKLCSLCEMDSQAAHGGADSKDLGPSVERSIALPTSGGGPPLEIDDVRQTASPPSDYTSSGEIELSWNADDDFGN